MVRGLDFEGNHAIDDYTLSIAIGTTNSSWFARNWYVRWLGLGEKRSFDPDRVPARRPSAHPVLPAERIHGSQGGYGGPRKGRDVRLTFQITEGPPIVVTAMDSDRARLDPAGPGASCEDLPLREGAPFNRFLFQASADTIISRLRNRGYPAAEVFRNFAVDRAAPDRRRSRSRWLPGPAAGVRAGAGWRAPRGWTPPSSASCSRRGRASASPSRTSSRASGSCTRPSCSGSPPSPSTPPATSPTAPWCRWWCRSRRARAHRLRSSVGFATNDCFRGGVGWTDRNLFGTGRLFDISGRVSKVGVGRPFDFGLEHSLCQSLEDDTDRLVAGELQRHRRWCASRGSSPRLSPGRSASSPSGAASSRSTGARKSASAWCCSGRPRGGCRSSLGYRLSFGATTASAAHLLRLLQRLHPGRRHPAPREAAAGHRHARASPGPGRTTRSTRRRGHIYAFDVSHSSRLTGSARLQTFTRLSGRCRLVPHRSAPRERS